MNERKQEFMEQKLPELFRNMKMLGIGIEDINNAWKQQ